jgi:A/G-specific adenine glycosylase
LIQHYVDNARALPWRALPGSPPPDPYRVWLSEIMLQQTTVAAVIPRFQRFVARWPTVEALAAAPEADVLSEWAGLGYYARARNLIACARVVAARGGFPKTPAELRALPGIGDYTAAAIAAIAFGTPAAAVDTNVRRVVARLFALSSPTGSDIAERLQPWLAAVPPGDLTQALMDLGATICRPRAPRCGECPLSADCAAYASGNPEQYPSPKIKRERPQRHGLAFWNEQDGHVWLVRRPARGLLGGMAALPVGEWSDRPLTPRTAVLGRVRHVFTHFTLDLTIVASPAPGAPDGWWQPLASLDRAGLPTLFRRASETALAAPVEQRAALLPAA